MEYNYDCYIVNKDQNKINLECLSNEMFISEINEYMKEIVKVYIRIF